MAFRCRVALPRRSNWAQPVATAGRTRSSSQRAATRNCDASRPCGLSVTKHGSCCRSSTHEVVRCDGPDAALCLGGLCAAAGGLITGHSVDQRPLILILIVPIDARQFREIPRKVLTDELGNRRLTAFRAAIYRTRPPRLLMPFGCLEKSAPATLCGGLRIDEPLTAKRCPFRFGGLFGSERQS